MSENLRSDKNATLHLSIDQIYQHCIKVGKMEQDVMNCIDLNCEMQKYYVDCYEVYRSKKECYKIIRKEVEQMNYKASHLKLD